MSDKPFTLEPTPSHASEPENATCKGCGRLIVWAFNPQTGSNVPLDPSAPVYLLGRRASGLVECDLDKTHMVSHFATCPKANDFSGSRRKA